MSDCRTGRHVVNRLNAHLVFTTKYRRDAIRTDRVRDLLKGVMTSVASDMGAQVKAVEAYGDRIHLLILYPPQLALSKLVGSLVLGPTPAQAGVAGGTPRPLEGQFLVPKLQRRLLGSAHLEVVRACVETQADPERVRIWQKIAHR